MGFIRHRKIGNHTYRYFQWSVREGKKVRTYSVYLGRVGTGRINAFLEANFKSEPGQASADREFDKWLAKEKALSEERASHAGAGNQPDAVEGTAPDGDHE